MSVRGWRIGLVEEGPTTWLVHYEPENGGAEPFAASIPKNAFEHRMAEHGLQTLDEAIEVLLYTPLLSWMAAADDPDALVLLEGDAATRSRCCASGPASTGCGSRSSVWRSIGFARQTTRNPERTSWMNLPWTSTP